MTGPVVVSPSLVVAGALGLVVLAVVWRGSVRRARAVRDAARGGVRVVSLVGRTVLGAGVIAGVQWLVLTHPASPWPVRVAALVVPALVVSGVLVRALTVTGVDGGRGRGRGGRR